MSGPTPSRICRTGDEGIIAAVLQRFIERQRTHRVKPVHEVAFVETNRRAIAANTHGRQNVWRPQMSKTMDSLVNLRWQQREDVFGIWTDRMTCMRPTEATAEVARMMA